MIVYRVEHIDSGVGPYVHFLKHVKYDDYYNFKEIGRCLFNERYCPQPLELEENPYYTDDYFYGFRSLDDLYKWFHNDECNNFLHANKFKIIVYDTKHVLKSRKQIVFLKNESHIIDKIPLVK